MTLVSISLDCSAALTGLLNTYSLTLIGLHRTVQHQWFYAWWVKAWEKLEWWQKRLILDYLSPVFDWHLPFLKSPLFIIESNNNWNNWVFFLFTEKSGPLHQHSALAALIQDGDEQSFGFYWGKNSPFFKSSPSALLLYLNFKANWLAAVVELL